MLFEQVVQQVNTSTILLRTTISEEIFNLSLPITSQMLSRHKRLHQYISSDNPGGYRDVKDIKARCVAHVATIVDKECMKLINEHIQKITYD